jgi:Maltogenic Amylase, C-terminal domain
VWLEGAAFAFLREAGNERILVALNRSKEPVIVSLPIAAVEPRILWGKVDIKESGGVLTIHNLGAWAGALIRL